MTDHPEHDLEDFRAFWQRPPFIVFLSLLAIGSLILLAINLDLHSFTSDRLRDVVGEARHLQKMVDEDIVSDTPMARFHRDAFPEYALAIIQSQNSAHDPRITERLDHLHTLLTDDELHSLLQEIHRALLEGDSDALLTLPQYWNARLAILDEPFAIIGASVAAHDHDHDHTNFDFVPETYHIHADLPVRVDDRPYHVQWRRRLDNFSRAAEPTFVHPILGQAWVRSDRAWLTLWNQLTRAILTDEDLNGAEEDFSFAWRADLRDEIHQILGEEHFNALLRGALHRAALHQIARQISSRGSRCRHNYRISRIPWLGFDTPTLNRMRAISRTDRLENCPRISADEADLIHRHSRDLQADLTYQQAMPRLLAAFLTQKSYFAAAHLHRLAIDSPPCPNGCAPWTDDEAAEIAAYLTGITKGPHPLLGIFKLCFDHRYGSPAALRGWLGILHDQNFRCHQPLPDHLNSSLDHYAQSRFTPIQHIEFTTPSPQSTPIYYRD